MEAFGSFMPGTGWSTWYWADSLWLSVVWADRHSEIYMDKYSEMQPDLDWRALNAEEVAKAVHDGVINAQDPRMDEYLRISKQFVEILPIDYIGITSLGDVMRMWLGEQLAVYWGGSWDNKEITDSASFEWGLTYLPPFTEEDFEGAPGTIYRVGGTQLGRAIWHTGGDGGKRELRTRRRLPDVDVCPTELWSPGERVRRLHPDGGWHRNWARARQFPVCGCLAGPPVPRSERAADR